MVLAAHSYAGFHNESKVRRRSGSHIFLSEDETFPRWYRIVLTITQVIKTFMYSAAEPELGAIFITEEELVPMLQTLI